MENQKKLVEIGSKVWEFRKINGFSKKLSVEIQTEIAKLCLSGITAYALEKATGVQRNSIVDWKNKIVQQEKSEFSEVKVVEETKPRYEVRLLATVHDCRVEIIGNDYSLLQRLIRKMSS